MNSVKYFISPAKGPQSIFLAMITCEITRKILCVTWVINSFSFRFFLLSHQKVNLCASFHCCLLGAGLSYTLHVSLDIKTLKTLAWITGKKVPKKFIFMFCFLCLNCTESFNTERVWNKNYIKKMFFRNLKLRFFVRRPAESLEWIIDYFKICCLVATKYCFEGWRHL